MRSLSLCIGICEKEKILNEDKQMRFQVKAQFAELHVLIADYTVKSKKLTFNQLNVQYAGSQTANIVKQCYKAPALLAKGCQYVFNLDGVEYEVFYVGR